MTLATLQANTTSLNSSTSDEYVGMGDEEEARRFSPMSVGEYSVVDLAESEDFNLTDEEKNEIYGCTMGDINKLVTKVTNAINVED